MDTLRLKRLAERSIHVFLKLYGIKTESGRLMDFRNHLFLAQPISDLSPFQVCMKSSQIGWSTLSIIKTIWCAKNKNWSIAYVLPTSGDAQEFSRTKVKPIIQNNPVLNTYVQEGDNIGDKRIGNSNLFFRGSFMERAAISFTADLCCFDEVDRSDQSVLATYASRLQHSSYKGEWAFSNPSVEGNGVSRFWAESDQKHWFIRCKTCNEEQYLKWPDSIDPERKCFQCRKCHAKLTDEERRVGRWVNKFKDRKYSGYWVSSLMASWLSADYILEQHRSKALDYFFNFVLGLPYIGEGNKVTPEMIYRNCTATINAQDDVVIGCDSGIKKHYVLGNREGLFYYGVTETWETIESLLAKYPRSIAVIDALPDLTEPRKLREKYPGRIFLCHYAKDRKTMQFVRWGKDTEEGNVNVDRNRMMQLLIDEFADGRIPLQGTRDDWGEFYQHFDTLYRMEEKDAQGNPFFVWETSNGMDHWAHAALYWRVGMDKMAGGKPLIAGSTERWPGLESGVYMDYAGKAIMPDPIKPMRHKQRDWRL